jgi:hypothetical protein
MAESFEVKDHPLSPMPCPSCGAEMTGAANVVHADRGPSAGDYAVCAECDAPLVFEGDPLSARLLTSDEIRELPPEDRKNLVKAIVLTQRIKLDHRAKKLRGGTDG